MPNPYTDTANRLEVELQTATSAYTAMLVDARFFDPGKLPDFDRYLIIISPPQNDAWSEDIIGVRHFQYKFNVDLYLLVKNFDDTLSIFGDTAPDQGLLQLIYDVKSYLRTTDLNGLLDRTYSEPAGPLSIEYSATAGFDSGEHAFVRRARLRYTARMKPFCHNI